MRRRREILGPICRHDELTPILLNAFEGRIGEANHWSQPWVNVQRGLAQAGAERWDEAARNLQAAVVVAGQLDHPLTATALLELGKLASARGDNRGAIEFLVEASLAAAQFEQSLELEESLRLANTAQYLVGWPRAASITGSRRPVGQSVADAVCSKFLPHVDGGFPVTA